MIVFSQGGRSRPAVSLSLALAGLVTLATPAFAADPPEVIPGQKLSGSVLSSEHVTVHLRGVEGTLLTLKMKATKTTPGLIPGIRLRDPDDVDIDLTPYLKRSATGNKVVIKNLPLPISGSYEIEIDGDDGTGGSFVLVTKGKTPKKYKGELTVTAPDESVPVPFDTHIADIAQLKIKAAPGSAISPWVRAFVPESGDETVIGTATKSDKITMSANGRHRFDVTGAAGSIGTFRYILVVKRTPAPKGLGDIRDYVKGAGDLEDNQELYAETGLNVVDIYVTIDSADNPESEEDLGCDHIDHTNGIGTTLDDVDDDTNASDDCVPQVNVRVTMDGLVDEIVGPNGEMRVRGHSTRFSRQKSYRIKLKSTDANEHWRGQRYLNLNKHPYDLTRFRNKLGFDLLAQTPHITSLRTQFVRLFVDQKDGAGSVDYGLFTHVERQAERFLAAHGLDERANVYKAEFFEFLRYPDHLKLESDPEFDETEFNRILEPKAGSNHRALLEMLDAVNDFDNDFDTVFSTFFNEENYLTWLGTSILFDNRDTNSQNFFLYSEKDKPTFYFLPWDYDGGWDFYGQPNEAEVPSLSRWQSGVSNWWGVMLHRRFLQQPGNLAKLQAKLEELKTTHTTAARIQALVDSYLPVVRQFVERSPDLDRLPALDDDTEQTKLAEFEVEANRMQSVIEQSYQNFLNTLERPMPIYMAAVPLDADMDFRWDPSFDLQGDGLTYDFAVATSASFEAPTIVASSNGLIDTTSLKVPLANLPAGTYYYRVIVRDDRNPSVNFQVAFDTYRDPVTREKHFGVRELVIE